MPLIRKTGNLLDDPSDAIVNPVNCAGVMGAGLALQFKQRWPSYFAYYRKLCNVGAIKPGMVSITGRYEDMAVGPWIVSFPTKQHWSSPSPLALVQQSFDALSLVMTHDIKLTSIAFPRVGCGLGGLSWADVEPLLLAFCAAHPDVTVTLYS